MEKDMFFGVNPSQRLLCYYSPRAYDVDGRPDENFPPNFELAVQDEFPIEGCFIAKPKTFKSILLSFLLIAIFYSNYFRFFPTSLTISSFRRCVDFFATTTAN